MFTEIQPLVAKTTLMIVVSTEGDQMRLSISAAPADSKTTPAFAPLSLLATPAELDAELGGALLAWQAPRKSLKDQVMAATENQQQPAAEKAGAAAPAPARGKTSAKGKATAGDKPVKAMATNTDTDGAASEDTGAAATGADGATSTALSSDTGATAAGAGGAASEAQPAAGTPTPAGPPGSINAPPEGATRGPANDPYTIELDVF